MRSLASRCTGRRSSGNAFSPKDTRSQIAPNNSRKKSSPNYKHNEAIQSRERWALPWMLCNFRHWKTRLIYRKASLKWEWDPWTKGAHTFKGRNRTKVQNIEMIQRRQLDGVENKLLDGIERGLKHQISLSVKSLQINTENFQGLPKSEKKRANEWKEHTDCLWLIVGWPETAHASSQWWAAAPSSTLE